MGKIVLKKKLYLLSLIIIVLCISLAVYIMVLLQNTDISKNIISEERINFSRIVSEIEQGNYDALEGNRGLYVTNDGRITISTIPEYQVGEEINLHRISAANGYTTVFNSNSFVSPIVVQGVQEGTLVVKIDKANYTIFARYGVVPFLPIILFIIGIITALKYTVHFIIRDILNPVLELKMITKKILSNDYSMKLTYDYDGEIGELCHDFETLRDELYNTIKREEKLKKNEKELLACISHDLKTPLASVSGYIEGIRSGVVTQKEQVDHYLDIIIKKTHFISKLIDDILEHSKTQLNEFSIDPKEVYAQAYFEEMMDDLSIDIMKGGFQFTCSRIPDVLILIDRDRIKQVVHNIVSNSMKYTESGGLISAGFDMFGDELVISIRDNGKGIAVNDISFIFDMFYRGEKARTMNVPGSGLGLNISKYIVEKHGGHIECDSVLNEGTIVRFSVKLC